jgi:hypothetical protein
MADQLVPVGEPPGCEAPADPRGAFEALRALEEALLAPVLDDRAVAGALGALEAALGA